MAQPPRHYFTKLTNLVGSAFNKVTLSRLDYTPQRTIWEMHGSHNEFDLRLKEIFDQSGRLYSYYVLKAGEVVAGFDNYPDRRALQEKYGQSFKTHLGELIPHKHSYRKETLELTEEMRVETFLGYFQGFVKK